MDELKPFDDDREEALLRIEEALELRPNNRKPRRSRLGSTDCPTCWRPCRRPRLPG